ncbi:uncharacterized protein OGAPODRAFT_10328 [Ogataea polymorpha]|uniref:uncharacterized protein n=1 Tax=Ogataea polymorpha TaxID=460523 RepID=UPI0007F4622B|nr:uncharacterized protein OGAPODRAFT_10328 [Ogataea polymorpha]OBA13662.1 hypothetical protein OGAPODRAFT_10328 [Ogataea polymorpha]
MSSTSNFLAEMTNSPVVVKLQHGLEYHGVLASIDGYMNMVENNKVRNYEEVFLRGNNVLYISQK